MKKLLSIVLTIALLLSIVPMGIFSITANAAVSGYYTYTVSNGEATITKCDTSVSGDIIIPSTLGGYPVTSIGDGAFYACIGLTSITIPKSVTSVSGNAFWSSTSLTSFTVDKDNSYYTSQDGILFNKTKTELIRYPAGKTETSYIIPDGVTSIGDSAFSVCGKITSIIIPNTVTSIGDHAFYSCVSLTSITIPNSVTSIDNYAFMDSGLTSITIPDSVASIDEGAFSGCSSLTSVVIPDSVTSIGKHAFILTSLTSITIPDSVTSIGENAFYNTSLTDVWYAGSESQKNNIDIDLKNTELTNAVWHYNSCVEHSYDIDIDFKCNVCGYVRDYCYTVSNGEATITLANGLLSGDVIIPSTLGGYPVTSIGDRAFLEHRNITSVTIPNGVTSIGDASFIECRNLTNITIPNSVTSIGEFAFSSCSSLTSITIPDSVTSIAEETFFGCSSLTSITIPNSVTSIGDYAFMYSGLTSIVIPDSVTIIGDYAFCGCEFTSITIPDGVTTIADRIFSDCGSLTSITIPDTVTNIGNGAFSDCSSLTDVWYTGSQSQKYNIYIDSYNTALTNAVWHYNSCIGAAEHTYDNNSDMECNVCGYIRSYYTYTVSNGEATIIDVDVSISGNVTIPSTLGGYPVTSIGEYAFSGCSNLTTIIIPNSLTYIGYLAFIGCSGLTSIVIPDSVTTICERAFYNCTNLTSITLSDSVKRIQEFAFYGCSSLADIWYTGSQSQKDNIYIDSYNTALTNAVWHYNSCVEHSYDNDCDVECNVCTYTRVSSGHAFANGLCSICNRKLGDINNDANIDVLDLVASSRMLKGIDESTDFADIDQNGVLDYFDITAIRILLLDCILAS